MDSDYIIMNQMLDAGSRWAHLLRFTEPPAIELQTKVRKKFTIMEKAPTRAISRLILATRTFAFKTLYQKHATFCS